MIYNVLCSLNFDDEISEISVIERMNHYIEHLSIPITNLKIFADCDINGYEINPEPEYDSEYYSDDEISDESSTSSGESLDRRYIEDIYWTVNLEGTISYIKPTEDTVDYFPLSTLQYILDKFHSDSHKVSGYVVLYNRNIDPDFEDYKALYYKVENSKLIYQVNKTQELTKHWFNIIKFKGGITINDIYPFNNDIYRYPNSFVNFLLNNIYDITFEDLNDETSVFIFNSTYLKVE